MLELGWLVLGLGLGTGGSWVWLAFGTGGLVGRDGLGFESLDFSSKKVEGAQPSLDPI